MAGGRFYTSVFHLRESASYSSWVARVGRSLTRGTARSLKLFGGGVGVGMLCSFFRWAARSALAGVCRVLSPPPYAWELATPLLRSASPRPGAQSFLSSSLLPLVESCCPFPIRESLLWASVATSLPSSPTLGPQILLTSRIDLRNPSPRDRFPLLLTFIILAPF